MGALEAERMRERVDREEVSGGVRMAKRVYTVYIRVREEGTTRGHARALIFMSHRHSDKNTGVLVQTVTLRVSFRATLYLGQVHTALDQPGGFT